QFHVWLMLAATAVFLFMSLPISQFIWEGLPLIDFVQFPWRFVGRAALPLAFLAGVPLTPTLSHREREQKLPPPPRGRVGVGVSLAVALLAFEAIPTVY